MDSHPLPQQPSFTITSEEPSPSSEELAGIPGFTIEDSDMDNDNFDEPEEEVDQLDSDAEVDDPPPPPQPTHPSQQEQEDVEPSETEINISAIKKSRTGKVERIPGHTLLPQTRLENMMHANGVTGSMSMSKEAIFVLSTAVEEFVKRMAQAAERQARVERRSLISYRDMAFSTQQYQEFMFLRDTIPQPVSLEEAVRRREEKERQLQEGIPAMASNPHLHGMPGQTPSAPLFKSKLKSRVSANGREKTNGGASGSRRESKRDAKGRWSHTGHEVNGDEDGTQAGSASSHSRSSRSSRHEQPDLSASLGTHYAPPANRSPSTNGIPSRSGEHLVTTMPPPPLPRDVYEDRETPEGRHFYHNTFISDWPGALAGPASGFLQNPPGAFARIPSQNPGRTIYTQDFHGNGVPR